MSLEKDSKDSFIENLVIIGSGPAGYTAAIYSGRANLKPFLITGFEAGGIPGGQLMTTTFVENYPGFPDGIKGPELMDLIKAQAVRWGTELLETDVQSVDLRQRPFLVKADGVTIRTHALIIATGARANRLNLPNEEKFWSKGISACAICDGATPQFSKEQLAVIGGGDSACEEAVYLTKYGSRVHLLVRSNQLRASAAMTDRVIANPSITVHWETEVLDVEGSDWLKALKIKRKRTNKIEKISVRGLFYAIGHTPNTYLFKGQLDQDPNGYLLTNPGRPETSIKGVFVAGDVADSEWRQGITAASSGCKAALAAERWLTINNLATLINRKEIDPPQAIKIAPSPISNETNFEVNALWQKGNYALRKLYHSSNKPLLVIYSSKNCGPCHVLKPQLIRVLKELEGKVQGIEIDIEEDKEIAKQAGINGTPTVQLFKQKALLNEWKGVNQRSAYKQAIINVLQA